MPRAAPAAERLGSQRRDPDVRRAEANEVDAKRKLDVANFDSKEALKDARYEAKKAKIAQEALQGAGGDQGD